MRGIFAAIVLSLALSGAAAAQERNITVTGDRTVSTVPDMAQIRVGVTTDAGTAAEALASNTAAMSAVMERLGNEGVEQRDLQTSTLDLGPRYADRAESTPRVVGYSARNILTVRVRDLDRLGGILDAVAQDGANTFEGLAFGLSEPEPLHDDALRQAVADARRKAQLLAEAAGVTLGEVQTIDTRSGPQPRPMEMAAPRMAADSIPVARGELELSASVSVVFAIAD